jgi:hypothetical protein
MTKLAFLCVALLSFSASATAGQSVPSNPAPQDLQAGVVIAKISCAAQADQTYALYLPSHYSREKHWPIFYVFDPDAQGNRPLELMKDAAERYGYIVAGSNNAHNGPWKLEAEAAQAMFKDTQARLSIDAKRVYFAGFSGGARFSSVLAQLCKCAAGVLLNSAGFAPGSPPAPDAQFSVFAVAGFTDFNYSEVVTLNTKLGTLHYAHAFREFEGGHQWAPASVMDEAFAWFQVIAMKDGREARDMEFVKEQAAEAEKRAKALDTAGDLFASWKEYRQDADTFEGFGESAGEVQTEAAAFRERAMSLEKEKAVRDAAKREQQDFDEQFQMIADISSGLSTLRQGTPNQADLRDDLQRQITALSSRAQHEKNPEKLRVLRRALGSIFVQAMEAGDDRYEAKDFSRARTFYELGAGAETDSAWAWRVVAAARAMTGDRKGTLEAIRQSKEKSKDLASFSAWLQEEPAFAKFRDTPEFRALAVPAPSSH